MRDLAAALYRDSNFQPSRILYIVAAQQTLHFQQLVGILKKANHPVADKIVHVDYGWVPGMKTREGNVVTVDAYLEEAHQRALTAYRQEVAIRPEGLEEDDIAEKVAVGATFSHFLSHSNIKDLHFTWSEALTFQGDSGPYLQYALARLYSIEEKAAQDQIFPDPDCNYSLLNDDASYELAALLARYGEILKNVSTTYEPYHLALYLLDIAKAVSKAYKLLRVVGQEREPATARLSIFVAAKFVLHSGLGLLGVPTVEKM